LIDWRGLDFALRPCIAAQSTSLTPPCSRDSTSTAGPGRRRRATRTTCRSASGSEPRLPRALLGEQRV